MSSHPIRVRYAPSPTGNPHIGNLRTAMFNWLFARRHGGQFILRIEDTDRQRYTPGAVDQILDGLEWLGIDWDEGPRVGGDYGPYFQSERLERYQAAADQLLASGAAYRCYCPPERVDRLRKEQARRKERVGYDSRCRHLSDAERHAHEAAGTPAVVRFAMPQSGVTAVDDIIRGYVEWQNDLTDDFVLVKSDGFPTYHMAVVVDDHAMGITHVLRAEEWLPSVPKHIQIYQALGYPAPRYAHLPMIRDAGGAKLSKRAGATPILAYRDQGYLPEAVLNYMALLGWSLDGATDVMDIATLKANFALERVGKAAAHLDPAKLVWLNGKHIRQLDDHQLAGRILPFLERAYGPDVAVEPDYLRRIAPLARERLKTLAEAPELLRCFFEPPAHYSAATLIPKGICASAALAAVMAALDQIYDLYHTEHDPDGTDAYTLEQHMEAITEYLNISKGQLYSLLRVAITGQPTTPPLFPMMAVMGAPRVWPRLKAAAAWLDDYLATHRSPGGDLDGL